MLSGAEPTERTRSSSYLQHMPGFHHCVAKLEKPLPNEPEDIRHHYEERTSALSGEASYSTQSCAFIIAEPYEELHP